MIDLRTLAADSAELLRSRGRLGLAIPIALSAALAALVALGFHQSNVAWFERHGTAEHITAIEMVDAFVAAYSDIRGAHMTGAAPVPASFRADAIERFNRDRDRANSMRILMVGVPGREIRIAATDADMAATVRALATETDPQPVTRFTAVNGLPTLRTIYPSVASQPSCVECHNRLQPQATPWRLGEVMGAFAVDRPADLFLMQSWREAILVGVAIFVAATMIGTWVLLLHHRRVRRDMEARALRERERLLIAAKENAEAASRAKSSFLALVSHELRTPLNAINGFSQVMAGATFGPISPKYQEYAADIHRSGTHLLSVINDILDMSKAEAGKLELQPEAIDLESLMRHCVALLRRQAADNHLMTAVDVEPGLSLWGDELRIRQLVLNLLSNAVKFTPPGGTVTISARCTNDVVMLRVQDTGIGIEPEDIPRAFLPFQQIESALSRKFEGTGLGLPLCKAIAEMHGGEIDLMSVPGSGTTVTVFLPARVAAVPEATALPSAAA